MCKGTLRTVRPTVWTLSMGNAAASSVGLRLGPLCLISASPLLNTTVFSDKGL